MSEKEKNTILDLINKWGETVQLRYTEEYIDDAFQLAESLFGRDQSQERFGYVLENIYRSLFVWFGYDEEKTKIQLKLLLDDLFLIAEADSEVETAEVDLIVLIKTHWGVDWGS